MRHLTGHTTAPGSDAISIDVRDEPGPGGAHHSYLVVCPNRYPLDIYFQKGPLKTAGVNGITHEALLVILIDRLVCFQRGDYACASNAEALSHLRLALGALDERTHDRVMRGVEGTDAA